MEQKQNHPFKIDKALLDQEAERLSGRATALRDFYEEIIELDKIKDAIRGDDWSALSELMERIKQKSEGAVHGFNQALAVLYGYAQIAEEIQRNGEKAE